MKIIRSVCWFFTLLLTFVEAVSAADLVTQRSWLEDVSGHQSFAQVQTQRLEPYTGVLSQGYGSSVIWIKLRIESSQVSDSSSPNGALVLRIRPVYLDNIQVFDSAAQGAVVGVTGDQQHPAQQALKGLDFMLPLAAGPMPRDVWLRVASTSTRQIHAEVLFEKELFEQPPYQHLLFALYVAFVSIFALWGVTYWVFTRDKMVGLFGVKQAAALMFALCSLGYMRIAWPSAWAAVSLDQLTSLFSMLATSAAIYFHSVFLEDYRPRPWAIWSMRVLVWMLPINLLLFYGLHLPILALQLNLSMVLVTPFVMLMAVLTAQGWRSSAPITTNPSPVLLPKALMVGFYGALVVILLLAALPGLGLASGGEIGLYLVQAHGLASGLMVLFLLHYRAHLLERSRFESQVLLTQAQQREEHERVQRHDQEKLFAMLAHELKTPLATMYMRLDEAGKDAHAIKQSIREMNSVIDRCVQANRLQDHRLQVRPESLDLRELLAGVVAAMPSGQDIHISAGPLLMLQADRQLLFIVLSNLLENACKYSAKGEPVHIELQQLDEAIRLDVCNVPGRAGLPDPHKVFHKYYRSPGAQGQAGTGLGLFLVRSLVELMGGTIAYQPAEQKISFVLILPKAV